MLRHPPNLYNIILTYTYLYTSISVSANNNNNNIYTVLLGLRAVTVYNSTFTGVDCVYGGGYE